MKTKYFTHPKAIVELGAKVGENTKIWAFVHILPGAEIGMNCNICDSVFIENDVKIGNNVTIKCGVQLWNGLEIHDNVFIGPNATFTNDQFPRSKQYLEEYPKTILCEGASIGANATILPGLMIGENAMIGAGSVVTRDVPQNAVVVGNPARIKGYVSSFSDKPLQQREIILDVSITPTKVPKVKLYNLPIVTDIRGQLIFSEYDKHLPFIPKRFFVVHNVPSTEVRGQHAHKNTFQFLVCLRGSVNVIVDNVEFQDELILNQANIGLYIPPLIWGIQYKYSGDAILLVLASEKYNEHEYIRNYNNYKEYIKNL